jgi:potassium/chloride transporter 9
MTDKAADEAGTRRRMPPRSHSNFAARTANDDGHQLDRRSSIFPSPSPNEETPLLSVAGRGDQQSHGAPDETHQERDHGIDAMREWFSKRFSTSRSKSPRGTEGKRPSDAAKPRPGAFPRPVGGTSKLGTFAGVFVPTTLNVLSILMFLRFGFILGQAGVIGMMGMLIACYAINLLTTMSISAIATNGTVRGGGAYYLISRSLGPEFGGSIGIVFYLGMVFNTSMNSVGLIDCFIENFGSRDGGWAHWMQQGFWWQYLWATVVLVLCTIICLAGSGLFARCSNGLLVILLIATFSIPFSALVVRPFESRESGVMYTGPSFDTLRANLMPQFTKNAAGSQIKGRENWQDLFGILFPATGGIFA